MIESNQLKGKTASSDSFFLPSLPGIAEDAIDSAYRAVRDLAHAARYRALIEQLWGRFAPVAEPDFRSKAATALHQAFWEMYLFAALTEHGLQVGRVAHTGPDFFVDTPTGRVWIEAVAPGAGEGPDAVPPHDYGSREARRVPEDQILMRYTSAMRGKAEQFERAIRGGVVRRGEAYVVAINSREADPSYSGFVPFFIKAFLPIGHPAIGLDPQTGNVVEQTITYRDSVSKKSGSVVPTDTFLSGAYPNVSALLHSRVDCANVPSRMGGDFELLHNSRAEAPVGDDLFAFCKQTRVREDGESFSLDERVPPES